MRPNSTILVTGGNGFIASHCIHVLLSQDYNVITTVRSSSKASIVLSTHSNHPKLSVCLVPSITAPNCYDEILASDSCEAILHLASPFPSTSSPGSYETDLLIPAIDGTLRVCEAASKFSSIKRVVLTSSFASVYDASAGLNPDKTYTEDDWAPLTYEDGKNAPATPVAYRVSKVLAENTAWEYIKKKQVSWDLVALCPGMVFGAVMPGSVSGLSGLGTSNAIVWSLIDAKDVPETRAPGKLILSMYEDSRLTQVIVWTSVTALAAAHVKALVAKEAANQRFLVTGGTYDMQELADILHGSSAISEAAKKRVPVGVPGTRIADQHYKVDNRKCKEILQLEEPSLEDTVVKLVEQILDMEKESKL